MPNALLPCTTTEVWYLLWYGIFYIFDNLGQMVIMYWRE